MTLFKALSFGAIFGLPLLLSALPAGAFSHKTLQEVAGNPGRSVECAKGDTKVVRKIVSNTIKHAKERFKLTGGLVNDTDTKRAQKEMYDFLNWKIGSPSAVCGQYITAGQKHFNKGYSDEAAAALLGMELPGAGRAEYGMSKKTSEELKARIKDCAKQVMAQEPAGQAPASQTSAGKSPKDKVTAQAMEGLSAGCKQVVQQLAQKLEQDYSIPPELTQQAVQKVAAAAANQAPRVSFNMPKSWDVENSAVQRLIAERRTEKAAR